MSLSEKRLAEIRERANLQCGLDGDDADDLLIHIDHLSAENARLRAGVEALADRLDPLARIWQEEGEIELSVPMKSQVASLRALLDPPTEDCTCGFGGFHDDVNPRCRLNPPTEGETDRE